MKYSDIMIEKVNETVRRSSGLEKRREYLGMSMIGYCPKVIYERYYQRQNPGMTEHRNCYRGYYFESETKRLLIKSGVLRINSSKDVVSSFDTMFRGHIDGEDNSGNLIEIKSMTNIKFEKIVNDGRGIPKKHYMQIQAYMKAGNYPAAYYVAVSTELFPMMHVVKIGRNEGMMLEIEDKARNILNCIKYEQPPKCECGYCK